MRKFLAAASFLPLAACGGAGPQTVSSIPAGGGTTGTTTGGTTTTTGTFVSPTEAKTYSAIGGVQSYHYVTQNNGNAQGGQLYAGDASTARNSGISISYSPRDAIFEVKIDAPLANTSEDIRFQDPAHRTDFGGASQPQTGTPQLSASGVNYLQVGSSTAPIRFDGSQSTMLPVGDNGGKYDVSTFFYQKPGTETKYVTFAGYLRNSTAISDQQDNNGPIYTKQSNVLERAAFVYGERTDTTAVPKTGTASFTGPMVATMVFNPMFDTDPSAPTYFQWIDGRSTTSVDFGAGTVKLDLTGNVLAPQFDAYTSKAVTLQQGATFAASGSGKIDLTGAGGFTGQFGSAGFTNTDGSKLSVNVAGSSIDGAFFGPAADEVGGGFRIVGGTPDQRVDILGAFTGKK